jgi:hypothetical protein
MESRTAREPQSRRAVVLSADHAGTCRRGLADGPGKRDAMSTLATLLAQRRQLMERLEDAPGPREREEIARLLAEIDEAIGFLNEVGPGSSSDQA